MRPSLVVLLAGTIGLASLFSWATSSLLPISAALLLLMLWLAVDNGGTIWQAIRGIGLTLKRIVTVGFGTEEQYADDLAALKEDAGSAKAEILDLARDVHNWGSRNAAAAIGAGSLLLISVTALEGWWRVFALVAAVAVVTATHWPALRRRFERQA